VVEASAVSYRRARFVAGGAAAELRGADFDAAAVSFELRDLLRTDLANVTHCYCANLCFSRPASERLGLRLAATPSVRRVAALAPLFFDADPRDAAGFPRTPTRTARVHMSWNAAGEGTEVLVYDRIQP